MTTVGTALAPGALTHIARGLSGAAQHEILAGDAKFVGRQVAAAVAALGNSPLEVIPRTAAGEVAGAAIFLEQASEVSLRSVTDLLLGRRDTTGVVVRGWHGTEAGAGTRTGAGTAPGTASVSAGRVGAASLAEAAAAQPAHRATAPSAVAANPSSVVSNPNSRGTRQAARAARILITVMDDPGSVSTSPRYINRVLQKRGADVTLRHLKELDIDGAGRVVHTPSGTVVEGYTAVISRGGAEHRDPQLKILRQLQANGMPVRNTADVIAVAGNKARTAEALHAAGVPHPRTLEVAMGTGTSDELAARVQTVVEAFGDAPVVVKPVSDKGGAGIVFLEHSSQASLRSVITQLLERPSTEGVIVQDWLQAEIGRDVRAFVVRNLAGGIDVLPRALLRVAPDGLGAANAAKGAALYGTDLTSEQIAVARRAGEALGMDYGGVDFIMGPNGPVVVEVNTSAGTSRLIDRITDTSLANRIADQALGIEATKVRIKPKWREWLGL